MRSSPNLEERHWNHFFPDLAIAKAHSLTIWVPNGYRMRHEATRVGSYQIGIFFLKDRTGILARLLSASVELDCYD